MNFLLRVINDNQVLYISNTENINSRIHDIKKKSWYKDSCVFQYIELEDSEQGINLGLQVKNFLIHRDNIIYTNATNIKIDYELIKEHFKEDWKPINEDVLKRCRDMVVRKNKEREMNKIKEERKLQKEFINKLVELKDYIFAGFIKENKKHPDILISFFSSMYDFRIMHPLIHTCKEVCIDDNLFIFTIFLKTDDSYKKELLELFELLNLNYDILKTLDDNFNLNQNHLSDFKIHCRDSKSNSFYIYLMDLFASNLNLIVRAENITIFKYDDKDIYLFDKNFPSLDEIIENKENTYILNDFINSNIVISYLANKLKVQYNLLNIFKNDAPKWIEKLRDKEEGTYLL